MILMARGAIQQVPDATLLHNHNLWPHDVSRPFGQERERNLPLRVTRAVLDGQNATAKGRHAHTVSLVASTATTLSLQQLHKQGMKVIRLPKSTCKNT
jgi:hypothetical protein